nr:similar to protein 16 from Haloarcula hispanica virus 1 [uncultured archaeal virus]
MSMEDWAEQKGIGRQFNWFWYFVDIARNAFKFEDSSFQAAIGKRRSGKSVWTLSSCCAVDPDFTEEQICFGLKELKAQMIEKTETSLLWEEAGESAYNRDFMTDGNKLIVKRMQVYGYRKIALFANYQHMKFLDGDVRLQLDCIIKMKAQKSFTPAGEPIVYTWGVPLAVVTDWIQDPILAPYKVEKDGVYQPIGQIPVPQMWDLFEVCGVSKSLYKNYLKKKDEYFQEMGEPEKEDKEEVFSKRELKTLTRVNSAYLNLTSRLIDEEKVSKTKIASLSGIPVSTLNVWLSKSEEAEGWISRVSAIETTTNNLFENH